MNGWMAYVGFVRANLFVDTGEDGGRVEAQRPILLKELVRDFGQLGPHPEIRVLVLLHLDARHLYTTEMKRKRI